MLPFFTKLNLVIVIFIEKNTVNVFVLELSQILTPAQAFFLFEFYWEGTNNPAPRYFTAPDTSTALPRYNEFTLTESDSGITTPANNVPVWLDPGQYRYNVYASTTPINILAIGPVLATGVVSTGKMVVEGVNLIVPPVYQGININTTTPNVYS